MIDRVKAAFDWLPETLVHDLFWACVHILNFICKHTGISYEALNIWVFIIIQPALIVLFALLWFHARRRLANYRHNLETV